jgi:hypothetical protein
MPIKMTTHYTVALVVDPDFGCSLAAVSSRIHTWIVATTANAVYIEEIRAAQTEPRGNSIESGITTFRPDLKEDRSGWCENDA